MKTFKIKTLLVLIVAMSAMFVVMCGSDPSDSSSNDKDNGPTAIITSNGESEIYLAAGSITQLGVEPVGANVAWDTDDETVATVDQNGLVTALGPGITTITAKSAFDDTIRHSITVTVEPAAWQTNVGDVLGRVKLDPDNAYNIEEVSARGTSAAGRQTFYFLYLPVSGDFTMRVKLDSVSHGTGSGASSVAGFIAIPKGSIVKANDGTLTNVPSDRALLYASAILIPSNVSLDGTSSTRRWMCRVRSTIDQPYEETQIDGGATNSQINSPGRWIMLRREGNLFTAAFCTNGTPWNWTEQPYTVMMDNDTYVGIWVTAGNSATRNADPEDITDHDTGQGPANTGRTKAGFSDWRIVYGKGNATSAELDHPSARINLSNFID